MMMSEDAMSWGLPRQRLSTEWYMQECMIPLVITWMLFIYLIRLIEWEYLVSFILCDVLCTD